MNPTTNISVTTGKSIASGPTATGSAKGGALIKTAVGTGKVTILGASFSMTILLVAASVAGIGAYYYWKEMKAVKSLKKILQKY